MKALVTGAAGFIGSTMTDRLLDEGWMVRGVDSFSDYYDPEVKRANLSRASTSVDFELVESNLARCELAPLFDGVDVVFHFAGQPGVRLSWSDGFRAYSEANIDVTQGLLEVAKTVALQRFVYASSSSVYGEVETVPTDEQHPTRPYSPYGVTKLAGEHLCAAYGRNFAVPTTSVRFFTVYGPRQRPDMAFHRLIEAALDGSSFPLFGDGRQVRDFTYVDDIVEAMLLAGRTNLPPGTMMNAAGGAAEELHHVIDMVSASVGREINLDRHPAQPGDVRCTGGSIDRGRELLGWEPQVDLALGIARQVEWHVARRATMTAESAAQRIPDNTNASR